MMTFEERLAILVVRYAAHPDPLAQQFVARARRHIDRAYRTPLAVRWLRAVRKRGAR